MIIHHCMEFYKIRLSSSSFTRYCRDTIQARWKTFSFLCGRFIQDTVCLILSESAEVCRRYVWQFAYFFGTPCICVNIVDFFARRIQSVPKISHWRSRGCFMASDNDHYRQMHCVHVAQTSMASHQVNVHPAESAKQEQNAAPTTDTICGPLCCSQMFLIVGLLSFMTSFMTWKEMDRDSGRDQSAIRTWPCACAPISVHIL